MNQGLLFFIFICQISFGQKAISIDADMLNVKGDEVHFYKKINKNEYLEIEIVGTSMNSGRLEVSIEQDTITKQELPATIQSIKKLATKSSSEIVNTIKDVYYIYKDRDELSFLREFTPQTLQVVRFVSRHNKQKLDDTDPKKWDRLNSDIVSYFTVNLNKRKKIVYLVNNNIDPDDFGYIIPFKEKTAVYYDFKEFKAQNSNRLSASFLENLTSELGYNYYHDVPFIIEGNYIKDIALREKMLPNKFDSIQVHNLNFYIGSINNKAVVFNQQLKDITPKAVRAIFPVDDKNCQVLLGNKVKWLAPDGNLLDKKIDNPMLLCGTVSSYSSKIVENGERYTLVLEKDGSFVGALSTATEYDLFSKKEYDSVNFLNGKEALYYDQNDLMFVSDNNFNTLVVEKDGKYGLRTFNVERVKNNITVSIETSVTTKSVLAVDYDAFEFGLYHPLLFQRDGLFGYFNINKKPKYTSLHKFENTLARFTLPNGIGGWLTKEGVEYLDK
jgi:hypothetical protein